MERGSEIIVKKVRRLSQQYLLVRRFLTEQVENQEVVKSLLGFVSAPIVIWREGGNICGVGLIIPAYISYNEKLRSLESGKTYLPKANLLPFDDPSDAYQLRLYGNGSLFESLQGLLAGPSCLEQELIRPYFNLIDYLKENFKEGWLVLDEQDENKKEASLFMKVLSRLHKDLTVECCESYHLLKIQ